MKWGWDSIPACQWRVDKFHEEEAMDLWRDEEADRETIEWMEEENRWQDNEHGGIYYWGGRVEPELEWTKATNPPGHPLLKPLAEFN